MEKGNRGSKGERWKNGILGRLKERWKDGFLLIAGEMRSEDNLMKITKIIHIS